MHDLNAAEIRQLLDDELTAHVGVVSKGEPYVTPVSFVLDSDELLFRTVRGRRLEAIESNPRVCVEVSRFDTETGDWESVVAWGAAYVVDDPDREERLVTALHSRYRDFVGPSPSFAWQEPAPGETVFVAVPLEEVGGRSSGKGFAPRTRPGRL